MTLTRYCRYCSECRYFKASGKAYIRKCTKDHKPKFYYPTAPDFEDGGYKRRCEDFSLIKEREV